eukprot:COSAG06_NODE_7724_length_2398_cov_3.745542_1_plen_139_part_10
MASLRRRLLLLPLLHAVKLVGSAAAPACLWLGASGTTACHQGDGSFAITRPAPSALDGDSAPPTEPYRATTTLGGCEAVAGSSEAAAVRLGSAEAEAESESMVWLALRATKRVRCPNGMEATVEDTLVNETDGGLRWDI